MDAKLEQLLVDLISELRNPRSRGSDIHGNPRNQAQFYSPSEERVFLNKLLDPFEEALRTNNESIKKQNEILFLIPKTLQNLQNAINQAQRRRDSTTDDQKKAEIQDEITSLIEQKEAEEQAIKHKAEEELKRLEKEKDKIEKQGQYFKNKFQDLTTFADNKINNLFSSINENLKFHGGVNPHPLFSILEAISSGNDPKGNLTTAYFSLLADNISKMLSPLNLFVSAWEMLKKSVVSGIKKLDEVSVSFMRTTGMVKDAVSIIREGWDGVRYLNVSMEEYAQAHSTFMDSFSGFSKISREAQKDFAQFGAVSERMGVSLGSSAKVFSFFKDALGQGTEEVKGNFGQILGLAENLGQSLKKVMSDFEQSIPRLSRWGTQIIGVFKEVAATAKALNIETSEVISIAEKFSTFDSASQSVGRFNAVLGGPFLNTLSLMNKTEAQVIQTLNEAMRASGRSFMAMNQHEKQAIANAAGITDLNTATRIFSGSLSGVSALMAVNSVEQEEMNERSRRAATIMDRLKTVFDSLMIAIEPLVDVFQFFVGILQKIAEVCKGFTVPAIFLLIGGFRALATGTLALLPKMLGGFVSGLFAVKAAAVATAPAIAGVGAAVNGLGAVAKGPGLLFGTFLSNISLGLLKFGAVAALVYGAFRLVGSIADWFHDALNDTPLEEFRQEIIDPLQNAPASFAANISAITSLFGVLSDNVSKFNSLNKENITALGDAFQRAHGMSGSFLNDFKSLAQFSVTPFANNTIEKYTNYNVDDKNSIANRVLEKLDAIIEAITNMNGTTPVGTSKKEKQAQLSVMLDKDVLADVVVSVIEDKWAIRGGSR